MAKYEWGITAANEMSFKLEELKFIFDQAEKQLKQSIEISAKVVTRTTILLTIIAGVLTSLFGFSFNRWNTLHLDFLFYLAGSVCIYLFLLMLYTCRNILGKKYMDIGSEPKALLHDHYILRYPSNDTDERMRYYYLSEIRDYQDRIEKNKEVNDKRWSQFKWTLLLVIILPVIVVVSCFVYYLFWMSASFTPCV